MKQPIGLDSCMDTELTQNIDKNLSGGKGREHAWLWVVEPNGMM